MLVKSSGLITKFAMIKPNEAVMTKHAKMYVKMELSPLTAIISRRMNTRKQDKKIATEQIPTPCQGSFVFKPKFRNNMNQACTTLRNENTKKATMQEAASQSYWLKVSKPQR